MSIFSDIGSAIRSALTAPGTSEANRDRGRKAKPQELAGTTLNAFSPTLGSQAAFAGTLEPQRQRAILQGLYETSPNGIMRTIEGARRGFTGEALAGLPTIQALLSGHNAGIGAIEGAKIAALNHATQAGNDFFNYYMSPEVRDQMWRQRLALANPSIPGLNDFSTLANIVYGRPAPQVGQSPLAGVANLAGLYYGTQLGGAAKPPVLMSGGGYYPTGGASI